MYLRSQIVCALVFGSRTLPSLPSCGRLAISSGVLGFLDLLDSGLISASLDLFRVINGLDVGVVLFGGVPLVGVVNLNVPSILRTVLAPGVLLMLFLKTSCKVS